MAELRQSVVEVLSGSGGTAGTGFLVADDLVLTCAHVITGGATPANGPPPGPVYVRFLSGNGSRTPSAAEILPSAWRGPSDADVAVLRLTEPIPTGCSPLRLAGRAAGGRRVQAYGFPVNAPEQGHYGYAMLGDRVKGDAGQSLVQLRDCTEITEGFSGAPAIDTQTGLVLGMVDSVAAPDRLQRGVATAYLTPAETLRNLVPGLVPDEGLHPYRGLGSFTAEDREWFFGREAAVAAVLERFTGGAPPVVALLGPSGTGKTSLVQAGVLPALAEGALPGSRRWAALSARPGSDPWAEMARIGLGSTSTLAGSIRNWRAKHPEAERLLLVLDQFEEIFSSRAAATERTRFLSDLSALAHDEPAVTVLIVMRDDFYSQLAASAPALMDRLAGVIVNVPPVLTRPELAAIVTDPAHRAGGSFEPGLVDDIVADAIATATADTGTEGSADAAPTTVLPLLEFALTELWESSEGWLTRDCYRRIGRLAGALASRCDAAFEDLPEAQQVVAQRLLVHLVEDPGERGSEAPLSRRRIRLSELPASLRDNPATRDVSGALADRRLVVSGRDATTGEPTYELIHDSLLRHWRRLREWLEGDVVFRSWRSRLEANYAEWRDSTTSRGTADVDLLLRGNAVEHATEQLAIRGDDLSENLVAYIETSATADRRRRTRDRRRVRVLTGILALMTLLAGVAWDQRSEAQTQTEAVRQGRARELALAAVGQPPLDPEVRLLRARLAYELSPTTPMTEIALRQAVRASRVRVAFDGHKGPVLSAAFGTDGTWVASGGADHRVRIWDPSTGKQIRYLSGHDAKVTNVAIAPSGDLLASADVNGEVLLWNTSTWARPIRLDTEPTRALAFSREANLAVGTGNGRVYVFDRSGDQQATVSEHEGPVTGVAFSPDGQVVASVSEDETLRTWAWQNGTAPVQLRQHAKGGGGVAFSLDGAQIASGEGWDGVVRIGPVSTPAGDVREFGGHNDTVRTVAFSPDGERVLSASKDGTIRLWDPASKTEVVEALRGHTQGVHTAAFSPDGRYVVSASDDGTARVWEWGTGHEPSRRLRGHQDGVFSATFSPDGRWAASAGKDSTVRIWDRSGQEHTVLTGHTETVYKVAFSQDSEYVASASWDGTTRLWRWRESTEAIDVFRQGPPALPEQPDRPDDGMFAVAFSRDEGSRFLAAAGADTYVRVWDRERPGSPPVATLKGHQHWVTGLTFAADGRHLLSSSWDHTARIWDWRKENEAGRFTDPEAEIDDSAFGPDDRVVVTAGFNGKVRVWDRADGKQVAELSEHTGVVSTARFDRSGRWIVTAGGGDGSVRLWEWSRPGPALVYLRMPGVQIKSAGFDATTGRLVIASLSGLFVEECEVCRPPQRLLELAKRRSTRELSERERQQLFDPDRPA